ncbi:PAS domain S-box protein [Halovenus marina]|uniref:PAS domain S-box protein n=1 Tax=Halovenus marina TaxID=3396621 RepID=UPI003F56A065
MAEKQRRALSLGIEFLNVENGHIQRRNEGETDAVVASVGDNPDILPEGTTLDRATTYCRRTVEADSPIALSNAPEEGWEDDPAYREHGFDCYLGTTIFVRGDIYGTVCFLSTDARPTEFTNEEQAFVELVARLLGRELEANEYEAKLTRTEQAQERSAEKYEALLRLAPDAVFVADADTATIIEVNEKSTDLTGYPEDELCGMPVLEMHPAENRDQYAALFDSGFDESPIDRFDDGTPLYLRCADGSNVPVEMSLNRFTVNGQTLVQGIVRDVSARREREQTLKRTSEFLQQTQEVGNLGGWEVDLEAETLRWSDEVYRIHDLPLDYEPTMDEAMELFHPEDRPLITDAFQQLRDEGDEYDLELRIVTADGAVRWVHTIGRPVYDDGELIALRGVIQDITERKERERDLYIKSKALEASTIGITIADADRPNMPIVYANEGFTKLTGYPRERVLGNNCRFLQGEETDEAKVADIRAAIEEDAPIQTELLNYRSDGTPFWNKLTIAPVTGEDSDIVEHYVGIQEDVTAKKRQDRLIEVLDRVLRHNIRNDMTAVKGYAAVIANRTDGEIAEMARRIEQTAMSLAELSQKARKFETAIRDAEPLAPRDICDDVRAVVTGLRNEYPAVEFRVEAAGCKRVMATERVRLALQELGENAAKHGDSSTVTYQVATTDEDDVEVRVRDRGPGLPEVERTALESGHETPLEHSSGLGLWLVNWIVSGLGGDVEATVDDGTTVTVRFPAADEDAVPDYRTAAINTSSE